MRVAVPLSLQNAVALAVGSTHSAERLHEAIGGAAREAHELAAETTRHWQALMNPEMLQRQHQGNARLQGSNVLVHCRGGVHSPPIVAAVQQQLRQHCPEYTGLHLAREQVEEHLEDTVERFQ